jgi:hypothetical protein
MVPGMSSDHKDTFHFLHYPYNAQKSMLNKSLKEIEFTHKNVYYICRILRDTHHWDQILTFGIFHAKLKLLTNRELYNIINKYRSQNQCYTPEHHNTVWFQLLDRFKQGAIASQITYHDLCDAREYSSLTEIPSNEWTDIMGDIITKSLKNLIL